jgi:hypothetical protein
MLLLRSTGSEKEYKEPENPELSRKSNPLPHLFKKRLDRKLFQKKFDQKRRTPVNKNTYNSQTLSGVINRRNGFSENLLRKGFIENHITA